MENYSSRKIIRRGKLFDVENYSTWKIICRGKLFVGENYSSGKIIRRGKLFVGDHYSSGKFSSVKIIRRGEFSSLFPDEYFLDKVIKLNMNLKNNINYSSVERG